MSAEKKLDNGLSIVFAEGCFDQFEGSQEELDEFVREIENFFGSENFLSDIASSMNDMDDMDDMDDQVSLEDDTTIHIDDFDYPKKRN